MAYPVPKIPKTRATTPIVKESLITISRTERVSQLGVETNQIKNDYGDNEKKKKKQTQTLPHHTPQKMDGTSVSNYRTIVFTVRVKFTAELFFI